VIGNQARKRCASSPDRAGGEIFDTIFEIAVKYSIPNTRLANVRVSDKHKYVDTNPLDANEYEYVTMIRRRWGIREIELVKP
jgi:hypothetical protein